MKLERCPNGHFYDSDRYIQCPHCSRNNYEEGVVKTSGNIAGDRTVTIPDSCLEGEHVEQSGKDADKEIREDFHPELPPELSFFRLAEKLGSGRTGTVYRIEQKKEYAVKVISRCEEKSDAAAKHEFMIAEELSDDRHFPAYYGMYQTESHIFLVQDIEKSWREYTRQHSLNLEDAVVILKDILLAVIAMHKKGYLHMDIKPDNIFVDSNRRGRLGDFSHSVKMMKGQVHKTIIGTDRFIAPEILLGKEYSGKEDMYSLGITMYMILTGGKYPYDYTDREKAYRGREDQFISDLQVPETLMRVIKKATAFDPEDRYVNLYEMLGDYMDAVEGLDRYLITVPVLPVEEGYETNGTEPDYLSVPLPASGEKKSGCEENPYLYDIPCDCSVVLRHDMNPQVKRMDADTMQNYSGYSGTRVDEVCFSAFTDQSVRGDNYGIVEIAMYVESCRKQILEQIREEFQHFKEKIFHKTSVRENQEITVVLSSKEVDIEDDRMTMKWNGESLLFTFDYYVPEDYSKNRIPFTADVYFDGVPATKLKFYVDVVNCEDGKCIRMNHQECSEFQRNDVKSAFLSYASQDRNRVTAILQGIQKARPDMDVFFDVETLRSGQNWEKMLYTELLQRDVLFLCWSHFAQASVWVEKEWRFMLTKKGVQAIEPIPMEDPQFCPPPEELKEKHFNDLLVQYRKVAEPLKEDDWEW